MAANTVNLRKNAVPLDHPVAAGRDPECGSPTGYSIESMIKIYGENQELERQNKISRHLTDSGNAERFTDMWHRVVRYNHTRNIWYLWTGSHWEVDARKYIYVCAKKTVREIYIEAGFKEDDVTRKETADWARKSEAAIRITAMLDLAKNDPQISTVESDYDKHPDLLNTPDGVYDLRTGERNDHDPSLLIRKIKSVEPDLHNENSLFTAFLDQITCGRKDLVNAIQRLLGSGLSGSIPKERIGIFYGHGANGKSVLIEAVCDVLGDYARTVGVQTLSTGTRASGHSDDIAALAGARLVHCSEPNNGVRLDESRIKALTGGDSISTSRKHEKTFTFYPVCTIIMSTNHKPRITGQDHAIWRRVGVYPFGYTVPESKRDRNLKDRLVSECGRYILAWLIVGAVNWYESGYGSSETVETATGNYRRAEDVIQDFFDECCCVNEKEKTRAGELRKLYESWCKENGYELLCGRSWREAIEAKGFTRKKDRTGWWYNGLSIRSEN